MRLLRTVLALLLVLTLSGCAASADELRRTRLEEVVATTFDGPVAFTVSLDAAEGALEGLGGDVEPLAALLAGSSLAGVVEGDRVAVGLTTAGVDLLQVRVVSPGEQYLRLDLAGFGELVTGQRTDLAGELELALAVVDVDEDVRRAVLAAATGDWVRLEAEDTGGTSAGASVGGALQALLRSAEPTDHLGRLDADGPFDGQLTLQVELERALAAAADVLAGVAPDALPTPQADGSPDALPVRVTVEDGEARTVVVTLGRLLDASGPVELVLELRPLSEGDQLVRAPDTSTTLTAEQLQAGLDALGRLGAGRG